METVSLLYESIHRELPIICDKQGYEHWRQIYARLQPGQYVYIERTTKYDSDSDPEVTHKMIAKIAEITMPKYSFFSKCHRGNLTLQLSNGKMVALEENSKYGGRYLSKAFLDELKATPTLGGCADRSESITVETLGDDYLKIKQIMQQVQKEHEEAKLYQLNKKQEQQKHEQEQRRLEQERQRLNREAQKGLDDLFRKL